MLKQTPMHLITGKFITLVFFVDLMMGCVFAPKTEQKSLEKDFEVYAKQVFIHQNQVLDELMYLTESGLSNGEYETLYEAERKLQDACELLNDYAVHEIDGVSMSWYFQNQVKNSVAECDQTIKQVEETIHSLSTSIQNQQ